MLQAKMSGTCKVCGARVLVGEWISYDGNAPRGQKVAHSACARGETTQRPLSASQIAGKFAERLDEHGCVGLTVKQVNWLRQRLGEECADELDRAERAAGRWPTEQQARNIEYLRDAMPRRRDFDVDLADGRSADVHVWPNGAGFMRVHDVAR